MKSNSIEDLTGRRFGRLTVIEREKGSKWLCRCDCGTVKAIWGSSLKNGVVVSCGCYHKELTSKIHRTHGGTGTRLHMIWQNMKARCYRKSAREYENYGGRGITVCEEWIHDFKAFYDWAMANGYRDDLTIDRIDNDKGYSPDNCRWITNKEQQSNKRDNVFYELNGETKSLNQWSEELGICYKTLQKRIREWGVERAFTTPLKTQNFIDITGQKFGRLTVLERVKPARENDRSAYFKCLCDCGNTTMVRGYNLRHGKVVSCGCYKRESASKRFRKY